MSSTVHIAGAGLAGLACAVRLAEAGRRVVLYESAPQAGGRCRSFHDATLDRRVDNGSHMVLSGNRSLLDYARRTGGASALDVVRPAAFPFLDLRDGRRWTLKLGGLWLFDPARRVPGTTAADYLAALRTLVAGPQAVTTDILSPGTPLFDRLWGTLIVSAMNGAPDRVSARLFGAVLRETLLRGEAACRPVVAARGLAEAFVEPALRHLDRLGATVRLGARVDGLLVEGGRATGLSVAGQAVPLGPGDAAVLAVPSWAAARLLPGLEAPPAGAAIVNAHFRLERPAPLPGDLPFLGLVGGTAEWLFLRGDVLSVTVSDADALAALPSESVAERLWRDCAAALGLESAMPPVRVVKEKRATFDQSPANAARRPGTRFGAADNLFLAGDWTDTGLPATLEGAVRSGDRAARAVLSPLRSRIVERMSIPALALPRGRHI